MTGDEQERFEDYLELERYIAELQQGRAAHPPGDLTPIQARVYRMVALFRSASPGESELRPEFAVELKSRLEQALQQQSEEPVEPVEPVRPSVPKDDVETPQHVRRPPRRLKVARRTLLTGGAAAAASLIVGAGIGAGIEKSQQSKSSGDSGNESATAGWSQPLVGENHGTWLSVTTLAALGDRVIRFATDTVVGYVIRNDDENSENSDSGPVIAVSAACTHMGCIVQWQDADHKFHCPCHGGLFTEYGEVDKGSAPILYLAPLPRLKTKVEKGEVFVEVPTRSRS